jgi:ATP-dependent DNA helicase RecQ
MEPPVERDQEILDAVKHTWGFDSLRSMQLDAIRAEIDYRDSLVVMPTGGGKSLCYQVPPLIRDDGRGTGIVVSPLISLMNDQVAALLEVGYPAAALHSNVPPDDVRAIEECAEQGEYRLLFVAPERLFTSRFQSLIRRLGVKSIAIDEAHCISHWGHDFRPEYRRLAELREVFPDASMHAYTATATPRVREDVAAQLHLRDPRVLVGTFDRPNLIYRVVPRVRAVEQIANVLKRRDGEAAIVYCMTRRETEEVADSLTTRGVDAACYHAGLTPAKRRAVETRFSRESLRVVVATVAFGMGIDRSNVRAVIHASMPKSIEHYQQETGRAGRDGLEAECVLLYSAADIVRWQQIMAMRDRDDDTEPDPEMDAAHRELLEHMHRLASGTRCRHKTITEYFGQEYPFPNCNACDVCLNELAEVADSTVIAQKILSCVARVGQTFGAGHVIDVLLGRDVERVRRLGHDSLSTHGLMRGVKRETLSSYINQLIDLGVLARSSGEYPVLRLNEASMDVMKRRRDITLLEPKTPAERTHAAADSLSGDERVLFESLRTLRRQIADERAVPAFVVFSDATLKEMARSRPTSLDAMRRVRGVGDKKLAELGPQFCEHIRAFAATPTSRA